jgi:hypothetical protein
MSKINYCSLDEAWGDNTNSTIVSEENPKTQKNINNDKIYGRTNYDYLNENSKINRNNLIQNMNKIERNIKSENNEFRINPNETKQYMPFQESIDKKQLEDKLNYLESEINKYKLLSNNDNNIESFENKDNSSNNNDIFDLIVLIIIGLIIIFVMNSIFNLGKKIGSRGTSG